MIPPPPHPSDLDCLQEFIGTFSQLHLPMLQKLALVGLPNKLETVYHLAALRVASFHVSVVTFQMDAPLSKVDAKDIELLLTVVEEVSVCG
jgi:hypothetical protein